ncbi:zinc finger protein-like 1 [Brachionichthys hirsutus]|uniref:zinc finger protein-like 1 n=1 Tax=Brachionichthys hirsutus TaxID=412623 RepID=UPI003604A2D8
MGLCKCPKRKVTNLFCFEHRVNVCEHCLVLNHNKCIVQSYLQWLQDSDYNPNCTLCNTPLTAQDTVRLVCYDVFHWSCLNDSASRLPLHTAPAGYQCPVCQGPVFPPANLASPIADVLKEQLASVNWARAGLGLPLIEEPIVVFEETSANDVSDYTDWSAFDAQDKNIYHSHSHNTGHTPPPHSASPPAQEDLGGPHKNGNHEHSVVNFAAAASDTITMHTASSPRKIYDTRDIGHSSTTQIDFDDDKYRRRPALSWFAQVLKNRTGGKRTSFSLKQRIFMLLLVGVLGFFTLIIIMAKLGRATAGSDPNLDPLLNPNIHVGKN